MENYLQHHGIPLQKWGVRRFQNPDGTLTAEGKARYRAKNEHKIAGANRALDYARYRVTKRETAAGDAAKKASDSKELSDKEFRDKYGWASSTKFGRNMLGSKSQKAERMVEQAKQDLKNVQQYINRLSGETLDEIGKREAASGKAFVRSYLNNSVTMYDSNWHNQQIQMQMAEQANMQAMQDVQQANMQAIQASQLHWVAVNSAMNNFMF